MFLGMDSTGEYKTGCKSLTAIRRTFRWPGTNNLILFRRILYRYQQQGRPDDFVFGF